MKRLKRILSIVVAVSIVLSGVPGNVKAAEMDDRTASKIQIKRSSLKMAENEEEEEAYTPIYTLADLAGINNDPEGNYILMNDIDMTEETKEGGSWDTGNGWTPLNTFYGTLDGNGHRIIGMHIYGEMDRSVGLFSRFSGGAVVKNLGMVDVDIDIDGISAYSDYNGIGAIVGQYNAYYSYSEDIKIMNCFVTGSIISAKEYYVGGIIGYCYSWPSPSKMIKNCYNKATVSGNGISGTTFYGDNCYNVGKVTGFPMGNSCYHSGTNCYTLADTSQKENRDVNTLTEAQMRLQSLYVGFNFNSVWEIDPYSLYPYPQLQNNPHERVESLEMITVPDKIEYDQGEKLDITGAAVKICYEGGVHEEQVVVLNSMLAQYDIMELGEQDIYVWYGGKSTYFTITVNAIPIDNIDIGRENITVQKGASVQLSARVKPLNATDPVVSFSSSDPKIAKVDETGKVTGVAGGTATITVTATNTVSIVSQEYTVSVVVPCKLLMLEKKEQSLYRGETVKLSVSTISPLDTTDALVWTSSNSDIVDVDQEGNLLGIAPGTATITVTAGDIKAICSVTVNAKMGDFSIVGVEDKAYTGKAITQNIAVTDGNTVLKEKQDYQLTYQNNTNPGTAKVVVTGIGYYVGSITAEFTITNKSVGANTGSSNTGGSSQNTGSNNNTGSSSGGSSGGSSSNKQTTGTKKTVTVAQSKISSLKNVKGKKAKLKFKKVSGAYFYWIRYSTKASMKGAKMVQSKKTTYTIKFPKKKKYYVQVRAVHISNDGTVTEGKWSVKKSVKIRK